MAKSPKRPRDPNQLGKSIIDIATSDPDERRAKEHVAAAARKGGQKGGPARAKSLTPEQRSKIAHEAAMARWKKS